MSTEIFVEPELMELEQPENAQEWFEICSQLGLEGQVKHADRSEEKKAPPYMHIDPKTNKIIMAICPVQVQYKDYSASTIPLDVLKEIQKAESNGWYQKIYICYDDKSPDPFVVGMTHGDHWSAHLHLIARWGNELIPFEQLEAKAVRVLRDRAEKALRELQFNVNLALEDVDKFLRMNLAEQDLPKLHFGIEDINKWR